MIDVEKYKQFIGMRSGKLVIEKILPRSLDGKALAVCKCDCGNKKIARVCHIRDQLLKSCGKCGYKAQITADRSAIDLTGKMSGWLKPIRPTDKRDHSFVLWECECTRPGCGRHVLVSSSRLSLKKVLTCGKCGYKEEQARERCTKYWTEDEKTLGLSIFTNMHERCYNKNNKTYRLYGARGIYICDEWLKDRYAFVKWSLEHGYKRGLTIDRIDVNGPYSPENCRWVDLKVQENNRTNNRRITVDGISHTCSEWADIFGVSPERFYCQPDDKIVWAIQMLKHAKETLAPEVYERFKKERITSSTCYRRYFGTDRKISHDRKNVVFEVEGLAKSCSRWDTYFRLPDGYMQKYYLEHGKEAAEKMLKDRLAGKKVDL